MSVVSSCAYGQGQWFVYLHGDDAQGYAFKLVKDTEKLDEELVALLNGDDKNTLQCLSYGEDGWYLHANEYKSVPAEFGLVIAPTVEEFVEELDKKLDADGRLKFVEYGDGHWVGFFEGQRPPSSAMSYATAATPQEINDTLTENIDKGLSLKCASYSKPEDTWFLYFDAASVGDAQWVINSALEDFAKEIAKVCEGDEVLRVVKNGGGIWFAYFEGTTEESWGWNVKPNLGDLQEYIKEMWDQAEGEGEGEGGAAADEAAAKDDDDKKDAKPKEDKKGDSKSKKKDDSTGKAAASGEDKEKAEAAGGCCVIS